MRLASTSDLSGSFWVDLGPQKSRRFTSESRNRGRHLTSEIQCFGSLLRSQNPEPKPRHLTPAFSVLYVRTFPGSERHVPAPTGGPRARGYAAPSLRGHILLIRSFSSFREHIYTPYGTTSAMADSTAAGGSLPLDQYTKTTPPGWKPGNARYPLRAFFPVSYTHLTLPTILRV